MRTACLVLSLVLVWSPFFQCLLSSSVQAAEERLVDESEPLTLDLPEDPGRIGWPHILGFAGLVGGAGIALAYKREADDRYEEYQSTADPSRAADLLRQSQQYDRRSVVGWVIAQASFVGLFYLFTRPPQKSLVPVEGEPVVRRDHGGLQFGWRVSF